MEEAIPYARVCTYMYIRAGPDNETVHRAEINCIGSFRVVDEVAFTVPLSVSKTCRPLFPGLYFASIAQGKIEGLTDDGGRTLKRGS